MLSFLPFMHNVAICGSCALWFYAANLAHGALPNWMPGDCDLCTRLVNAYVPVLARVLCVFTSIFSFCWSSATSRHDELVGGVPCSRQERIKY